MTAWRQANKRPFSTRFHNNIKYLCKLIINILFGGHQSTADSTMAPYTNGKRKFDAIDLTGDDDLGSSFRAPRASPGDVSQSQRDSWLEQGDEADAGDIIISSQDGDDSVTQSFQLYGTLRSQLG